MSYDSSKPVQNDPNQPNYNPKQNPDQARNPQKQNPDLLPGESEAQRQERLR